MEVCVTLRVLFFEIEGKPLHTIALQDTQIPMKADSCNKTGGLDIFLIQLSREAVATT